MFKGLLKKALIAVYIGVSFFGFFSFVSCDNKQISRTDEIVRNDVAEENLGVNEIKKEICDAKNERYF